jgi:hypothetical protein
LQSGLAGTCNGATLWNTGVGTAEGSGGSFSQKLKLCFEHLNPEGLHGLNLTQQIVWVKFNPYGLNYSKCKKCKKCKKYKKCNFMKFEHF